MRRVTTLWRLPRWLPRRGILGFFDLGDLTEVLLCRDADPDDQGVGVGDENGALGQRDILREDLGAGLESLDVNDDVLRDVRGQGLDRDRLGVEVDRRAGDRLTRDVDRDIDLYALTLPQHDQVDVLDDLPKRVLLHVLDEGELVGSTIELKVQDGVRLAQQERDLMGREAHVLRLGTVTVDDRGYLTGSAKLASNAFAEGGAGLGRDLVGELLMSFFLRHSSPSRTFCVSAQCPRLLVSTRTHQREERLGAESSHVPDPPRR